MLAISNLQPVTPIVLVANLRTTIAMDNLSYDAKVQVDRADGDFSSPVFEADTASDQTGWSYKDLRDTATTGAFVSFPNGGVRTDYFGEHPEFIEVAYLINKDTDLAKTFKNERLKFRFMQSYDGGTSWSEPAESEVVV